MPKSPYRVGTLYKLVAMADSIEIRNRLHAQTVVTTVASSHPPKTESTLPGGTSDIPYPVAEDQERTITLIFAQTGNVVITITTGEDA
jgi:hypothetical protein